MALSEYERRVLAQLEQDLRRSPSTAQRLTRLLPLWPLFACIASAIPVCVLVIVLAPARAGVACTIGAIAAIALVWGVKRKQFASGSPGDNH